MNTFSFYKGGIWKVVPSGDIDVPQLLDLIKSDKYKNLIEQLRLKNKEEQREFKRTSSDFDYVTVGGTFQSRGKTKIIQGSGLACIDLDDLKNIKKTKEKLNENKFVNAYFLSPSGKGLKVIIKIPIDDKYEGYFLSFCNSLGIDLKSIDKATRDISRACFLSYDPEPYYNPNSDIWITYLEQPVEMEWQEVELSMDKTRSGFEFREIVKLLREGKQPKDIAEIAKTQQVKWNGVLSSFSPQGFCVSWEKWRMAGIHYQRETMTKAVKYHQTHPTTQQKAVEMTIPIISLPEAMRLRKPKEWLIKGIFPTTGIIYFVGGPKCFKSTLAFHLALCCVTGRKFLGKFDIEKKCKILFIQEENDDDMLEKFGLLAKGMDFTEELEIQGLSNILLSMKNGIKIDTYGGQPSMAINRLLNVMEICKPDIVFFDSAVCCMEGDENKSSDVRKIRDTLTALEKKQKFLAVIIHHLSKAGDIRGSGDFVAQADVIFKLNSKPKYKGLVYSEIPYNRLAPGNLNKFRFRVSSIDENRNIIFPSPKDVDSIWGMTIDDFCDSTEEEMLSEDEEKVWDWINQSNNRQTFNFGTIKNNLDVWGFKERKLRTILKKFVDDGKLLQEGFGRTSHYNVPNQIEVGLDTIETENVEDI